MQAPEDRPLVKIVYDTIPQPAAGTNLQLTVPVGYRLELKTLNCSVVTDANIPDRNLFYAIHTNVGPVLHFLQPYPFVNGETRNLSLATLPFAIQHSFAIMYALWPFPNGLVLEEGSTLTIGLLNIQVGDQFSEAPYMALSQFVAE